jgi:hypothetical protein
MTITTRAPAVWARLELCHQGEELDLRAAELECPLDVAVGDRVRKRSDQAHAFIPHRSGEYRLWCQSRLRTRASGWRATYDRALLAIMRACRD